MSGRHKPLMHVIFLFPPAISPAFPHRSLLSPNHFKNGIYFCLENHALSLLIWGVRLHWDLKHTSSLNKSDIHFTPTRRYLLANQVWLRVVTSKFSCRENLKVSDTSYWSLQSEPESSHHCDAHTEEGSELEVELGHHVSLDHILGWVLQAPDCPALKVSGSRRYVHIPNLLGSCVLLHIFSDRFTLHDILALVPKDMFHKQQAFLTFRYSAYSAYPENTHFCSFFTKQGTPKPKAKVIWATSSLIFCLSSSLILCVLYQKVDYLVLGTWMIFLNKLYLKLSLNHFYSHIAERLSMSSGRASYPCLMQTPIRLRGVCIQDLLYWSPQPCFHERGFHHHTNATLIFE